MHNAATRIWRRPLADGLANGALHLGYDAVGVGEQDLTPADWVRAQSLPWVSSDLVDASGHPMFPIYRIVSKAGIRVGVVALTGPSPEWRVVPAATALRQALDQVRPQVDRVVLLSHVPIESLPADLTRRIDVRFDVHAGLTTDRVISNPTGGRWLAVVRIQSGARTVQVLSDPVDPAKNLDPVLVHLTDKALADADTRLARPVPPPSGYVGTKACAACHVPEYRQWSTTAHARAFRTLLDRHQENFPECVGCHVTGTTKSYLRDVQCEACHGPGQAHVHAPTQVHLVRQVPQSTCLKCHAETVEQGRFDAHTYFPRIRH